MPLDLGHGHAVGVEADHDLVDTVQAALALADELGLVAAVAVPWYVQLDGTCLGQEPLRSAKGADYWWLPGGPQLGH